ncbi:DUF4131 domain-containing protein [Paracoccus jiaweipingae]|uniref:DUF4131 domain-containing protein n=1 Tax=Paracoccus sp. p2-l61 TaxID=3366950 RepID=UPI0037A60051
MAIARMMGMGRQASARQAGVARRRGFARPAFQAGLLLWLPVLMGLGIGLWLALPYEPGLRDGLWLALPGLAAGLLWLRLPARWQRFSDLMLAFALAVAMSGAGFALAGWRAARVAAPVLEWRYYGPVEGRVAGIDRAASDKIRLVLDQVVLRDLDPKRSPHLVRVSLPHGVQALPPPGQRVMLTANLGPPPGPSEPGGFDFRRYAWFQGLGAYWLYPRAGADRRPGAGLVGGGAGSLAHGGGGPYPRQHWRAKRRGGGGAVHRRSQRHC